MLFSTSCFQHLLLTLLRHSAQNIGKELLRLKYAEADRVYTCPIPSRYQGWSWAENLGLSFYDLRLLQTLVISLAGYRSLPRGVAV